MNCKPLPYRKRNKLWIWTAVNHKQAGILAWVIGDRSAATPQAVVANCQMLALFLLCHRWVEGLSDVHRSWRPDCEQDLYDTRVRARIPVYGII